MQTCGSPAQCLPRQHWQCAEHPSTAAEAWPSNVQPRTPACQCRTLAARARALPPFRILHTHVSCMLRTRVSCRSLPPWQQQQQQQPQLSLSPVRHPAASGERPDQARLSSLALSPFRSSQIWRASRSGAAEQPAGGGQVVVGVQPRAQLVRLPLLVRRDRLRRVAALLRALVDLRIASRLLMHCMTP
jgi:hypothetical protein